MRFFFAFFKLCNQLVCDWRMHLSAVCMHLLHKRLAFLFLVGSVSVSGTDPSLLIPPAQAVFLNQIHLSLAVCVQCLCLRMRANIDKAAVRLHHR